MDIDSKQALVAHHGIDPAHIEQLRDRGIGHGALLDLVKQFGPQAVQIALKLIPLFVK